MERRRQGVPFSISLSTIHRRLTNVDIHKFIEGFTTRYASRLSSGEDLSGLYDYELEAFMEGVKVFHIDTEYRNVSGIGVVVRQRGDGFLVVEYEGELYKSDSLFVEEGVECVICSDIMFWADQIYNPNEGNDGGTEG